MVPVGSRMAACLIPRLHIGNCLGESALTHVIAALAEWLKNGLDMSVEAARVGARATKRRGSGTEEFVESRRLV